MTRILAIARQTFWEGVRMRIVLVSIIVLVLIILWLPFVMKGDETLAGRLQTFIAYSLGALSLFASLATVFFSCATLAGEIKNCQIHMVVTKPVSRFEILAGKWLGVNLLNILIVGICGLMIYAFANQIRRSQGFVNARDEKKVADVVWTARTSVRPKTPDFNAAVQEYVKTRTEKGDFARDTEAASQAAAAQAAMEHLKELDSRWRTVEAGTHEVFTFENLPEPKADSSVIQVKFRARGIPMPKDDILPIYWQFLDPQSSQPLMPYPHETTGRAGDMHEFLVSAPSIIKNGKASLAVLNYTPDGPLESNIVFEGNDSMRLFYKVGSFEGNFVKDILMLLSNLAFLSAVGLLFGVFVSFPVAALCTLTTYLIGLGHDWWMESIGANIEGYTVSADPYGRFGPAIRAILVPLLRLCFPNFMQYDGTGALVGGEAIPTELLGRCALHTAVFGGVLLLTVGWFVFKQREIAEVTV